MALSDDLRRITTDIPHDAHRRLREEYLEDGIAIRARVRALVELWTEDAALRKKTAARAKTYRRFDD